MSVLIRGMKMPKSCDECDLNYDCFRCILPIENSLLCGKDTANGRLPNCPLVELPPHGDLIDYNFCLKNYELLHDDDGNPVYAVRMRDINAAPTIIEAEGVSE